MSEPNYNHNVRVVTLVTGERVLCLFGGVRDVEDQTKITLNVRGSNKAVQIDLVKLREAITVLDT